MKSADWEIRPLGWLIVVALIGVTLYFGAKFYFKASRKQTKKT